MFLRQVPNVIYSKIAIQTLLLLCIIMSRVVFAPNYILGQNKSSVPIVFIFKIIFWIPFWTLSQLCLERDILTPAYLDISTLSHMGWSHQCEVYHCKREDKCSTIPVYHILSIWPTCLHESLKTKSSSYSSFLCCVLERA